MVGRGIGGPTIATGMGATQATGAARRTAKAEQPAELRKAQEDAEAGELRKTAAMSDLGRLPLKYLESHTGNVMVRKEPIGKIRDTVRISAVWLDSVTGKTFRAATGHKLKIPTAVAGKYINDAQFKMGLHNGHYVGPIGVLTISLCELGGAPA